MDDTDGEDGRSMMANAAIEEDNAGNLTFVISITGFLNRDEAERFSALLAKPVAITIGKTFAAMTEADSGSPPPNRMN